MRDADGLLVAPETIERLELLCELADGRVLSLRCDPEGVLLEPIPEGAVRVQQRATIEGVGVLHGQSVQLTSSADTRADDVER